MQAYSAEHLKTSTNNSIPYSIKNKNKVLQTQNCSHLLRRIADYDIYMDKKASINALYTFIG